MENSNENYEKIDVYKSYRDIGHRLRFICWSQLFIDYKSRTTLTGSAIDWLSFKKCLDKRDFHCTGIFHLVKLPLKVIYSFIRL